MWAFRFGAVRIHSHIKQGHQNQFKKIILSETPCSYFATDRDWCVPRLVWDLYPSRHRTIRWCSNAFAVFWHAYLTSHYHNEGDLVGGGGSLTRDNEWRYIIPEMRFRTVLTTRFRHDRWRVSFFDNVLSEVVESVYGGIGVVCSIYSAGAGSGEATWDRGFGAARPDRIVTCVQTLVSWTYRKLFCINYGLFWGR